MVQKAYLPLLCANELGRSNLPGFLVKMLLSTSPDFICVKTDEVIKFGPPGFRRPPIQTTVTAGYENHPETPFPSS